MRVLERGGVGVKGVGGGGGVCSGSGSCRRCIGKHATHKKGIGVSGRRQEEGRRLDPRHFHLMSEALTKSSGAG